MTMEASAEDTEYTTRTKDCRQQWRKQGIDDGTKEFTTTTEAVLDRKQARWIGNDNGVLIFLAIGLLPVTLSSMCLFAVSF